MVLDEVWRSLDAVEALSGPHGGPLRRTVKLILDPLVIRPVQHPECAGSILSADGAVLLTARINAAADVLRATAAWFTLLKQVRRALRITDGNAQDLYFQRCFELATVSGMPDAVRDRGAAEDALLEIHNLTAGRTTQALKDYLADPARVAELAELIGTAWRRRPLTTTPDHTPVLGDLLDACAARRLGEVGPEIDVDDLAAASIGTHHGIQLWFMETGGAAAENDPALPTAQQLGLTAHPLPLPPRVGESASKASLGLPFDRTIHERVFTVLQAASERADLPPIPELVDAEIARSCAPWALLDESLRVAAAAGARLAMQLQPIVNVRNGIGDAVAGSGQRPRGAAETSSAAARVINNRWQREAYVLQARRMMVRDESLPAHVSLSTMSSFEAAGAIEPPRRFPTAGLGQRVEPLEMTAVSGPVGLLGLDGSADAGAPEPAGVIGPLGLIAADLRVPWRPYLRRLWARVHGRDVRELPVYELDELWDLLDGVARSVMLDHRMRVKKALAATALAAELDEMESRAG
ncbi:hypothetical protein OHB26_20270 [Nocardia sp. NBC_01503]|uniref:hypothetical protein n=1 Tax=Nocardia sp. NBC_01503 TaxID=2975997 RepID=UPI002E7B9DCF|nr:hypothetical protein [Nocardia sp. NBC_01503]WTL36370.1 hypothetical protein OHB26_20270 [Nocardia sp. NBC_01503]